MKNNRDPFIHTIIGGNRMGVNKNIPEGKGVFVFKSNPEFYKNYKPHSVNFPVVSINLLSDVMAFPSDKLPSFPHIIVDRTRINYSEENKPNPETK